MGKKKKRLSHHVIPGSSKFARISTASTKIAEAKKKASLSGGRSVGSHAAASSFSTVDGSKAAESMLPSEAVSPDLGISSTSGIESSTDLSSSQVVIS